MSYIEIWHDHRFPRYARLFSANQRRRYGRELEPAKPWARSPKVFAGLPMFCGTPDRESSPIEPALRALITVLVSQTNRCAVCADINSATGLKRGLTGARLAALRDFEVPPPLDERIKAALAYTVAVTGTGQRVDDGLTARLKKRFDDDAIIELAALIAFQNLSGEFDAALGVAAQGFCNIPPPSNARVENQS